MMGIVNYDFGEQVRIERDLRGWSQSRLASELGVSQVTIHKIEKGRQAVSLALAIEIARVLGISLDLFVASASKKRLEQNLSEQSLSIRTHIEKLLAEHR